MKMTALKIAKAKHTRFGRLLCRVFGDERGAVMMEYVVLGVLVVAAVVAIVKLFGGTISNQFKVMIKALTDDNAAVTEQVDTNKTEAEGGIGEADAFLGDVQRSGD
ncbi:MAG: hypothetical protein IK066_11550 [Kiritimatiellae bacterium]|nr:hypothetical protein [Kiritimatiellia bacterium]